jgi:hypothetical protein
MLRSAELVRLLVAMLAELAIEGVNCTFPALIEYSQQRPFFYIRSRLFAEIACEHCGTQKVSVRPERVMFAVNCSQSRPITSGRVE